MTNLANIYVIFTLIDVYDITFAEVDLHHMEPYVVGGEFVKITKYPHSAFINSLCGGIPSACGSSVLNQKMVLTAAHCCNKCKIKKKSWDFLEVMLGDSVIDKIKIKRSTVDFKYHPSYSETTFENDIAILMIEGTFPLGHNIKRVVISYRFPDYAESYQGYVAGWGTVNDRVLTISDRLKHTYHKLRSIKTCANSIGNLHMGMFCAGSLDSAAAHPSQGDSGSALVMKNGYHQIGVVSFRLAAMYPSLMVYSNATYYYDWISDSAADLFCRNKEKQ